MKKTLIYLTKAAILKFTNMKKSKNLTKAVQTAIILLKINQLKKSKN